MSTKKIKTLEKLVDDLTHRLVTCPIDDTDKVQAELATAKAQLEQAKEQAAQEVRHDFQVGQQVTWFAQPRGGYNYIIPVKAKVVGVTQKRVKIEVELLAVGGKKMPPGTKEVKSVKPENLKAKAA